MSPKSVLVTGCSEGGIGDALAKEFSRPGLRVFATARDPAKIEHLKAMGLETVQLDVVDKDSLSNAVETVRTATGGSLDFLVNNSGSGYSMPLLDANIDVARSMFDVNVLAVVSVTQAFAPLLMASKGAVINIGSIAGKGPFPFQGFYNASKAAVNLLTDQLRIELEPFGIKVILVVTGTVRTRFFQNLPASQLPEDSIYGPARKEVEHILSGSIAQSSAMEVDQYAQTVVQNALKDRPTVNQWVGGSVVSVWTVSTLLWHTAWDFLLPKYYNLAAVGEKIRLNRYSSA